MRTILIALLISVIALSGWGGTPNSSATAYINNEPRIIKLAEVGGVKWNGLEIFIDGESIGIAEIERDSKGLKRNGNVLKRSFGPLGSKYGDITIDFVISSGKGLLGATGSDNYFDVKLDGKHWVLVDTYVR